MGILVTGAAGFIGSHLSKAIESRGKDKYTFIDDFSRGKKEYLRYLHVSTPCIEGDLRDYEWTKVITKNIDTVFHTACRIGGVQFLHGSPNKELKALQDNIAIDNNVFRACVANNVKKIIFTSSISVYNTEVQYDTHFKGFDEESKYNMKIDPEGGYGWAKFLAEKNLEMMSDAGIKVGILRIFKSYGPCDDYSPESGQVVLSLMRKAINYPKEPFVVWGDDSITRNIVYIDDLIDAVLKLENRIERGSLTVNIGGARPISVKEMVEKVIKLSGKDIKVEYDKKIGGGPLQRIPILDRAEKELGWTPTTDLDTGMRKSYEWMNESIRSDNR